MNTTTQPNTKYDRHPCLYLITRFVLAGVIAAASLFAVVYSAMYLGRFFMWVPKHEFDGKSIADMWLRSFGSIGMPLLVVPIELILIRFLAIRVNTWSEDLADLIFGVIPPPTPVPDLTPLPVLRGVPVRRVPMPRQR